MYRYTNDDVRLLKQVNKNIFAKIHLLDDDLSYIESLEGEVISGDISVDHSSAVRRTASITMVVPDDRNLIGERLRIWLNRRVEVYLGFYDLITDQVVYYSQGIFCLTNVDYSVTDAGKTVSLKCGDLMLMLNGEIAGVIPGGEITVQTTEGSNMKEIVVDTITQLGGISRYEVDEIQDSSGNTSLPYDLNYGNGTTVYTITRDIADIYPNYQVYFAKNGRFMGKKTSSSESDPIYASYDLFENIVISESTTVNFTDVKNVSEVFGKTIAVKYALTVEDVGGFLTCTENFMLSEGDCFSITLPDIDKLSSYVAPPWPMYFADDTRITMTNAPASVSAGDVLVYEYKGSNRASLVDSTVVKAVCIERNAQPTEAEKVDYELRYNTTNIWYEVNPMSPFAVEKIGELVASYSGGEYENIYNLDLARDRAKYNNWLTTRLMDVVSINTIVIPWLDVDTKVEYRSLLTHEIDEYIITNININTTNGTMNMTMRKFYPLYPFE